MHWTGLSYQERLSGSQAPGCYGISILVVFLCLCRVYTKAGRYRFRFLLVIPLGVIGAVLAATLRGFYNDIYFQVGLLAHDRSFRQERNTDRGICRDPERRRGRSIPDAAFACRPDPLATQFGRLSLAFVAGVMPLAMSNGAGAASQNDIRAWVIGVTYFGRPCSRSSSCRCFFLPSAPSSPVGRAA